MINQIPENEYNNINNDDSFLNTDMEIFTEETEETEETKYYEYNNGSIGETESQFSTNQEFTKEVLAVKKKPRLIFRPIKQYLNRYNTKFIQHIYNTPTLQHQILELELPTQPDEDIIQVAREIYPNIKEIKNTFDREKTLAMILEGNHQYTNLIGKNLFQIYLKEELDFFYVLENDNIIGHARSKKLSKESALVCISIRGTTFQKQFAALELTKYFRKRYANYLNKECGFKQLLAITLQDEHAALIKHINKKENVIMKQKLITENPEISAQEIAKKLQKNSKTWHKNGTYKMVSYAGKPVKEYIWQYEFS